MCPLCELFVQTLSQSTLAVLATAARHPQNVNRSAIGREY